MKKFYLIIALLAFFITNSYAKIKVNTQDSLALVDLYNSTDGPHWTNNTNWLSKKSPDTWYGVTVATGFEDNTRRLTRLDLRNNNLNGKLPASIGNWLYLGFLFLQNNHITGSIPSTIDSLQNLALFYSYYNQLSGPLPSFWGNMKKLSDLRLNNNQITGNIPPNLDSLNQLFNLLLGYNNLSGNIPPNLGNITSLGYIRFKQ